MIARQTTTGRHIYPKQNLKFPPRTDEEVRDAMELGPDVLQDKTQKHVTKGIQMFTPMILMNNFDMVIGFPMDYMHAILLGNSFRSYAFNMHRY